MPTSPILAQRLLVVQSFKEVSWGTAAAATAKWMALKTWPEFKPYRKSTVYDEARGNVAPGFLSTLNRKGGEFKLEGYLTYEDAILLGHGFFGIVSPTGSSPSFNYAYTGATTSQPTIQPYTFEYNQATGAALATGCIGNKLEIKGNAAEPLEWIFSGLAQDIDASTGSAITSLSDRSVEVALMPSSNFWMDTGTSTIGTTAFNSTLIQYNLAMENGIKFIYTAGSLVPTAWVVDKWKTTLTLDLLYTSAVKTFVTSTLMAGNQAVIRLKPVSGAKSIQLDFAGVLADDPALFGQKEGAQFVQVKLEGIYNTTNTLHTNMTAVNAVAAVP